MTSTKKLLTVLPILLLTGCPKNQPTTHSRQLGEACDSINQCLSGLYCEDGICRVVCTNDTQCDENASCVGGRCVIKAPNNCPTGFTGDLCDQCLPGFWGKECQECNCSKHGKCNDGLARDGSCTCDKGWDGPNCDQCADGYATEECVPTTCKNGTANSSLTGKGLCSKCFDKWTGDDCNVCPVGYYDGLNNCVDCRKGTTGSSFGTDKCTFSDTRNGETVIYNVVTINNQTWMAENLKNSSVKHYSANNVKSNDNKYGYLYIWQNAKKACPSGWRLPTKDEFDQLLTATEAGSNSSSIRASSWENGYDSSGFGALPADERSDNGSYYSFGNSAFFWSATRDSEYVYSLNVHTGSVRTDKSNVNFGYSVRCIKDETLAQ